MSNRDAIFGEQLSCCQVCSVQLQRIWDKLLLDTGKLYAEFSQVCTCLQVEQKIRNGLGIKEKNNETKE